ncbi:MAG: fimbrillin family protein [Bacteroidales bacterium]|nr:fimbrillin family protein [Bacteroidales bacterium]
MKKFLFLTAAAVAVFASCAKTIDNTRNTGQGDAVSFGVYAGRSADTKATYGDITTANLKTSTDGFGVFAFYTKEVDWAATDKPNFMYNQQVRHITSYASAPTDYTASKYPSEWYYTPLKYWPNGQNATAYEANATSADKLSFFAYAPHIATVNSVPAAGQGITEISGNTDAGVPVITFTVPAKAEEQIDLLWANPVLDATKKTLAGRVELTFKHALAKLNIQVRTVADDLTGTTANLADETKVILESLTLTANGTKSGKLSIGSGNNVPNWSDLSGNTSVAYGSDSFSATETVNGKTGFNVTETATDLNSAKSPMIIPATIAAGGFVITANYWVITADAKLDGSYSTIQNNITKTSTAAMTFDAGKKYNIIVNLGINSVDFVVSEVTEWDSQAAVDYHLPQNS